MRAAATWRWRVPTWFRRDGDVKGETVVINGDAWTVVDVAPAQPLAEMVAALLEDEGILAMVRGDDLLSDAFSNLGAAGTAGTWPRSQ